jgi:small subunit ribosomal protein S11
MAERKDEAVEARNPSEVARSAAATEAAAGGTPEGTAAGAPGEAAAVPAAKKVKSRNVRSVPVGVAHVRATFNNTQVTITDVRGGVVAWCSSGRAGFKGSRKSTAFAATLVGQDAARQAIGRGMRDVEVRVQGAGAGRESAIRALQSAGLNVSLIKDVTPIPHDGCRPRKRRRV